ncbi:hypothetical protein JK358_07785 [Nocardia sp. 2]|uniref:Uncharacterized protein n=1 Tax=Nocardia acididurans TaxID=2802282 RepID=A0ABS1M2J9_9NOCA|nr:hypothetical protein [Nocardia acididurans]MBL1074295.1 hypothetical protein [Nocardia acididurans]
MSIVFVGALVVLCAVLATAMWRSGDSTAQVASKYVALFGVTLLIVLALGVSADPRIARRAKPDSGHEGEAPTTIVPGSTLRFGLFQALWVSFALLFLGAAAETAAAAWQTHFVLVLVLIGLGVFAASAPALALAGRLRPGRIALTPGEIIYEGWSSRTSMRWEDVALVRPAFERVPVIEIAGPDTTHWSSYDLPPGVRLGAKPVRIWNLDPLRVAGRIVVECPRCPVDRNVLCEFLAFYAENPSARTELGTILALKRWQALEADTRR